MNSNTKPIQGGGICHLWRSPDGTFHHLFLKLNFDCQPDKYAGIVIVTDEQCRRALAASVRNLQKELPQLLQQIDDKPTAYWWLEEDEQERTRMLSRLTKHPVFADTK